MTRLPRLTGKVVSSGACARRGRAGALDRRGGLILMSDHASSTGKPQEAALQTLLRLIALRDRSMTSRLLAESPSLARQAIEVGATREAASLSQVEARATWAREMRALEAPSP